MEYACDIEQVILTEAIDYQVRVSEIARENLRVQNRDLTNMM